jgi:hypothetical protein
MRPIPPPCPVDDAPHTTCTSPDYVPSAPIVIVQLPCRDAGIAAATSTADAPLVPESPPAGTSFTTATYRRAVHGRKDGR